MEPMNNQQFGPTDKTNFSMENGQRSHGYRMILITGIVIIIAIGGVFVLRNKNLQQVIKNSMPNSGSLAETSSTSNYVAPTASTITNRAGPWVEVTADTGTSLTLNTPVTFTVKASSSGKDITAYDMLLAIDPSKFKIRSITSEVASFSLLQFEKGTHVSITGIKELGQNAPSIFKDTGILKVTVEPIQKGATIVSVFLEQKKEKTILVDTEVNAIIPQIGSLQVEVK